MRWWLFSAVLLASAPAGAGALGKVVGGIHGKAGAGAPSPGQSPPRPPPPPPPGPRPGPTVIVQPSYVYWPPPALGLGYYAYAYGYAPYPTAALYEEEAPPPPPVDPWFVEVYLGAQSVVDSDHSISFDLRVGRGRLALAAKDTSFFEKAESSTLTTRLDLFMIGPALRLIGDGPSSLWVELGFAGVRTVPDLSLRGAAAGARVEHALSDDLDLGLDVLGRAYAFSDDVRALELGVGVRWSILRLAWRQVDFNTGPPLRGPELGVALRF